MMAKVNPGQLEELITAAGVGGRTAKKLRDANNSPQDAVPQDAPASPRRGRGHGASRPSDELVGF